ETSCVLSTCPVAALLICTCSVRPCWSQSRKYSSRSCVWPSVRSTSTLKLVVHNAAAGRTLRVAVAEAPLSSVGAKATDSAWLLTTPSTVPAAGVSAKVPGTSAVASSGADDSGVPEAIPAGSAHVTVGAAGVTTIVAVAVSDRPNHGTQIDDLERSPIVEDQGGAGMTIRAGPPQRPPGGAVDDQVAIALHDRISARVAVGRRVQDDPAARAV